MRNETGGAHVVLGAGILQVHQLSFTTPSPDSSVVQQHIDVIVCACLGGVLHGVAMALRKYYGEGHAQYYLQWRWWVGTITDGVAGLLTWPAMPYVPVHVLVPIVIVVQLTTSYFLGIFFFQETSTVRSKMGLCCAIAGVIGVGLSTTHAAVPFRTEQFWTHWINTRFLLTNGFVLAVLSCAWAVMHRSTFYALVAAVCEGVQFICSRIIAAAINEHKMAFLSQFPVLLSFAGKAVCVLLILHFQQLGLAWDLSRFAGIYLVSCVVSTSVYGAAFFGDKTPISIMFVSCALCTLVGIALLNQVEEDPKELKDSPREVTNTMMDLENNGDEKVS